MHVDQMKYVLTVAKYLSFSKASDVLYISQSAISQSISKLEEELGYKFFVRSTKKVEVTEKGLQSLEVMKKIVTLSEQLAALQKSDEIPYSVRLSVVKGLYLPFISNLLNDTKFGSSIRLSEKATATIIENIKMGITDMGIIPIYEETKSLVDSLQVLPLIDIKLYVFVSAESPLARKKYVSIKDMANEKIAIYDGPYLKWLIRIIQQYTGQLDVLFYSTNQEFIRDFVVNKRAISIDTLAENLINPYVASKEVVSVPLLLDFSHSSFLGLVTKKEDHKNPFFQEIVDLIESLINDEQKKPQFLGTFD